MRRLALWAATPLAALALVACDRTAGTATPPEPSAQTLNVALAGDGRFESLEAAITNAGLETALAGTGPYTIIAPVNDAFSGDGRPDFASPDMAAQGAALVRGHLLPGAVTREDLIAAIEANGTDGASLLTMAGEVLTFTRDGDTIVVTGADGSTARLTGDEIVASNGVIQPADGLLLASGGASGS